MSSTSLAPTRPRPTSPASRCERSTNGPSLLTRMRQRRVQPASERIPRSSNHFRCRYQSRRVCGNREDNLVSKEKILVVEDAPDISSLLKIYFTSQGYEVMTAMRGQVALELCRKTPPNLALLDVNLPDMEGYDIGKTLRQSARTRHI